MARFIEGEDRRQVALLPERLDDYVGEDSSVRVIDVFVDELDLAALGFGRVQAASTGRPGYHPGAMLKLYLYGYLNQVQSSRRLEREAGRNTELMWLLGKLAPDFKTIADFRRDNGQALRAACAAFVTICRGVGLLTGGVVAVDGSRFKAANTRDKNYTPGAVRRRIEQAEASIERYLEALDAADRQEGEEAQLRGDRLKDRLDALRRQVRGLKAMEVELARAPDGQISLTDPDARAMATHGKGTGMVGYNVQAAVDAEHHLVVAHEVTNQGHDRSQLANMAARAKVATGADMLTVLADRGYFSGPEILACEQIGAMPYVPKPLTSGAKADGRFGKPDFVYDPTQDTYRCPAGETLSQRMTTVENGQTLHRYWNLSACKSCALKSQCTPAKERRVTRWEHEAVIEAMQRRLDRHPKAMRIRRQTVEHVFGTLKAWMGATHFKTRRMDNVAAEMSLHVLAYNLKRAIAVVGAPNRSSQRCGPEKESSASPRIPMRSEAFPHSLHPLRALPASGHPEPMPNSAYDDLRRHICVELGFCGSIKDGLPLHVDDLIPSEGVVTADQFAEFAFQAEGLDPRSDPKQLKAAIKAAFINLLGSHTVDATALR